MTSHSSQNSLRTPLGVVRGLGVAGHGTDHWWVQRLTSLALIPLSLWFAFSIAAMGRADYLTVKAWLASPCNAALALLLVAITFHHVISGVAVIMEDYIHNEAAKIASLIVMKFVFIFMAVSCLVSVLKIALGG